MNNKKVGLFIIFILSLCLCSVFIYLTVFLKGEGENSPVWEGYHTLIIKDETSLEKVVQSLENKGFNGIIHSDAEKAEYFDFSQKSSVLIKDLPVRFEEQDPRVDRYMKGLKKFFSARSGNEFFHVLYFPIRKNYLLDFFSVRRALSRVTESWYLLEINMREKVIFLMLFAGIIVLSFISIKIKQYALYLAVPWLIYSITGGYYEFISGGLMYIAMLYFALSFRGILDFYCNYGYFNGGREAFFLRIMIVINTFCITLAFFLFSRVPASIFLRYFFSFISTLFIFVAFTARRILQTHKFEHRLFFRIKLNLLRQRRKPFNKTTFSLIAVTMILFLSPLVKKTSFPVGGITIPHPIDHGIENGLTWEGLSVLWHEKALSPEAGNEVPDLSDYIAHRAYQAGYFFGREYTFPYEGEEVLISSYNSVGNSLKQKKEPVISYTDEWFARQMEEAENFGIPHLLLRQGRPVTIEIAELFPEPMSGIFLIRHWVVCFLMLLPSMFIRKRLTPQVMYGIKSLLLRRRRQAA